MQNNDNLARVMAMTDEEAYANALSDPDSPPLTDEQLARFVPLYSIPGNTILERLQNFKKRTVKQSLTVHYVDAECRVS